jgi:bacillithiol system protein YtxJ
MRTAYALHTIEEWNEFTHKIPSSAYGLIIFKFSPKCPISKSVKRSFDSWYDQLSDKTPLLCVEIDVINSRALSQHIEKEFDIRHESPQAIWITTDHHIHWHASHYSITGKTLDTQLGKIQNPKSKIQNPD